MNIGTLTVTLGCDYTGLGAAQTALLKFEKTATASINTVAQRFRTFGYLATAAVTAPIVMASKAAFKMASDYEFAIQKIVGLTGVAQSTVNEWSDQLLRMAPELARAPQELADALYFISSSGIKGARAMEVLEVSARAATTGLGQTQDIANLLTSVLNAYAGTGITAAYATDVLVAAVREGKAEADQFATAIGSVIPYAAQLNVSFDQVAGAMAAMTLTGASAANAATYLRNFLMKLIKPAKQSIDTLESLGMSFSDLRKVVAEEGLMPALERVRGLTEKYGVETLGKIFPNIRAMLLYLSLAGKNMKYNSELMQRVTDSAGSLGRAFAAVADTIKVRYDTAISAARVSLISLGKSLAEAILPILESLIERLKKLITWFNNLSDAEKHNKLVILAWIAAAGPLSLAVSLIMYSISGLITVVTYAITAFNGLRIAMMSNPYIALMAIIGTAIAALVRLKKKTEEASIAQDSFNTALVKVNGSIKLLKSLTDVDYSSMNVTELISTMEEANKQYMIAKKNIDDIRARVASGEQRKAGVQHYIDIQIDEAIKAKKAYESAAAALKEWGDNFGKIGLQIPEFVDGLEDEIYAIDEQTEALKRLEQAWLDIHADVQKYKIGEFMNLKIGSTGIMKQILKPTLPTPKPLTLTSQAYGGDIAAIMKQLGDELAFITTKEDLLNSTLGRNRDLFDSIRAKVNAYTTALWDLLAIPEEDWGESWWESFNKVTSGLKDAQIELDKFNMKMMVLSSVGNMISDIAFQLGGAFANAENAWQSMVDTILNTATQIVAALLVVAVTAETVKKGFVAGLITALIGLGAITAVWNRAKSKAEESVAMAGGGVVPPGYPNDSYPARLTSGETVLNPLQLANLQPTSIEVTVKGIQRGEDIYYVVEEVKRRKQNSWG